MPRRSPYIHSASPLHSATNCKRGLQGIRCRIETSSGGRAGVFDSVERAARPAWTPHMDPRLEALAADFELLLAGPTARAVMLEEAR
jgi:hypothetical protein